MSWSASVVVNRRSIAEGLLEELRPWIGSPPIVDPPDIPGYKLVRGEQLSIVRVSLLGLLLMPIWLIIYNFGVVALGGEMSGSFTVSLPNLIIGVTFAIGLIVFHEALHGAGVLLTGNLPSFGIGPGFAYTTCHKPLTRNGYLLVIVLPLLVINIGAIILGGLLPGAVGWMLFISIINTAGAGGDVWMLVRVMRLPSVARIVDLASGFAVYMPVQATTASPIEP